MKNLIDVIQILNNLNIIKRTGSMLSGGIPSYAVESIAEHSYRVSTYALIFGQRVENIRMDLLLSHVISHDWGESILGDFMGGGSISYYSYFPEDPRPNNDRAEEAAKATIFQDAELEIAELNEAELKLFKFCDRLALIVEIINLKSNGYKRAWLDSAFDNQIKFLEKDDYPFTRDLVSELHKLNEQGYLTNKYLTKLSHLIHKDDE